MSSMLNLTKSLRAREETHETPVTTGRSEATTEHRFSAMVRDLLGEAPLPLPAIPGRAYIAPMKATDADPGLMIEAAASAGSAVQYAIECGRELLRIKSELAHGEFGGWCAQLSFAERTVRIYMQAAKSKPQIGSTAADLVTNAEPSIRSFIKAAEPARKAARGGE
jgi:hypothetical protein